MQKTGKYAAFLKEIIALLLCVSISGCARDAGEEKDINEEKSTFESSATDVISDEMEYENSFETQAQEPSINSMEDPVRIYSWKVLPDGYTDVSWRDYTSSKVYEDVNEHDSYGNIAVPEKLYYNYRKVKNTNTNMYGIGDWEGNIIVEAKYSLIDYAFQLEGNFYFRVKYEGEQFLVDIAGNVCDVSYTESTRGYDIVGSSSEGYRILNANKEEVGGPYESVRFIHDVFYHEGVESRKGVERRESRSGDGIGFYDSVSDIDYVIDDSTISDFQWMEDVIRDEKCALYTEYVKTDSASGYTWRYMLYNYETGESKYLFDGSFVASYEDKVIYRSNNTYKCIDLDGNNILDERYFECDEICGGAVLKRENGEWIYLGENGTILEISTNFSGTGDSPDTYKGYPICTYYRQDEIPCVVVYNEQSGEYILYALTK